MVACEISERCRTSVGYIFRYEDSLRYHDWFKSGKGRSALLIEQELLSRLWAPSGPQQVLDVGCGTGVFSEWFAEQGHQVTGIDPSPYMLHLAGTRLPRNIHFQKGFAEDLPFEDGSFDTVALITTLEFVNDPPTALAEALRVARKTVLLGVVNKYSLITLYRRLECYGLSSVYRHARFFSIPDLKRLVEDVLQGSVNLCWKTCLSFPLSLLKYTHGIERSRWLQWQPFGHFIGMRVDPTYSLQTVQQPLFGGLPAAAGHEVPSSCWRFPLGKDTHPWDSIRESSRPTGVDGARRGRS